MTETMRMPIRIDKEGKIFHIVPAWGGNLAIMIGGRWYLTDYKENRLIQKQNILSICEFSEGRGWISEIRNEGPVRSLVDENGKEIKAFSTKDFRGEMAHPFREGLSCFSDAEWKYGFFDRNGDVAIAPRYSYARDFHDGYAFVKTSDHKIGFIDKEKNFYQIVYDWKRIPMRFDKADIWNASDVFDGKYVLYRGYKKGKHHYDLKAMKTDFTLDVFESDVILNLNEWDGKWILGEGPEIAGQELQANSRLKDIGFEEIEMAVGDACVAKDQDGNRWLIDLRAALEEEYETPHEQPAKMPEVKLQSFAAFAGEYLTPCRYDDSGDSDKAELDARYEKSEWLHCKNVGLALDVVFDFMCQIDIVQKEYEVLIPEIPQKKWGNDKRFCLHIPMIGELGKEDKPDVMMKVIADEEGAFLRLHWLPDDYAFADKGQRARVPGFAFVDKEQRAEVLKQCIPELPETLCGVQGKKAAIRTDWLSGDTAGAICMIYDFKENFGKLDKALEDLKKSLEDKYALTCEEPDGVVYEEDSCQILLGDGWRPWCDTLKIPGKPEYMCYAAVLYCSWKPDAMRIEAYLSGAYRMYK